MTQKVDALLQPLRIPAGWRVDYNILTELDPSPQTAEYFYGEWLFAASCQKSRVGVEISFSPEGDPEGAFMVDYYRIVGKGLLDECSQELLQTFSTSSREQVVLVVEQLMSNGTLP